MKELLLKTAREIKELEKVKSRLNRMIENAPEGSLRIVADRSGKSRYYQKVQKESGWCNRYIPVSQRRLAEKLAQKSYAKKLATVIENEILALRQIEKNYDPDLKYEIYSRMSSERKALVKPYYVPAEVLLEQWEEEEWIKYEGYSEYLMYDTEHGEKVRSKSEVILANLFHQRRDILRYRYEEELYLPKGDVTTHPDFTLYSMKHSKIVYWEHAGRMDDPQYADSFVRKMNSYIVNGIIPGDNLIVTYESMDTPLDIQVIKKLIAKYFE